VDDPAYWKIPLATSGPDAAASIAPGPSLSPPNSLRIAVNDSSYAKLGSSNFGSPATGVRCQLGLYVESRCTQNPATVFELTMIGSTVTYTLIVVLHKASDTIDQWQEFVDIGGNVDAGTGNFRDELPLGQFTRIALEVSAASLAISFDGQRRSTPTTASRSSRASARTCRSRASSRASGPKSAADVDHFCS
jgi:hypothetical protein